jgi:hypothetical protein
VIPQVLGTSAFDDEYVKSGLQRGLGVGFAFVGKDCTETDPTRVAMCSPKRERYYGGIVDFRLAAAVKPRLSLGVHEYDAPTLPGTLRGFEVAVQIASALHE